MTEHKTLVGVGEAAAILGVTPDALREWEKAGDVIPQRKSHAGTRYYSYEYITSAEVVNHAKEHKDLIGIGEAAKMLGVTPSALRAWEATGEIVPQRKSQAGTRYYSCAYIVSKGGLPLTSNEKT